MIKSHRVPRGDENFARLEGKRKEDIFLRHGKGCVGTQRVRYGRRRGG